MINFMIGLKRVDFCRIDNIFDNNHDLFSLKQFNKHKCKPILAVLLQQKPNMCRSKTESANLNAFAMFACMLYAAVATGNSQNVSPGSLCSVVVNNERLIDMETSLENLKSMGFSLEILNFLKDQNASLSWVDTWSISAADIVETHPNKNKVAKTQFINSGEGLIYSSIIQRAIDLTSDSTAVKIVDLGCGSSLPTLGAMLKNPQKIDKISLLGIDIDPNAIQVSQTNAELLGLQNRASFIHADLIDYLSVIDADADVLMTANPPYVPAPVELNDPFFIPVNAGGDGLKYLRPILKNDYKSKTRLVILASSLTTPLELIYLIQSKFKILSVRAILTKFGKYLNDPRLAPYIETLRGENRITYGTVSGSNYFLTLGFILEKI